MAAWKVADSVQQRVELSADKKVSLSAGMKVALKAALKDGRTDACSVVTMAALKGAWLGFS